MAIPNLEKVISEELSRITKIERMRSLRTNELTGLSEKHLILTKDLRTLEGEIAQQSILLKKAQTNLNGLVSEAEINALSKQIEYLQNEIDEKETTGLILIDEIPENEEKILEAKTFLAGSLETIREIEAEIKEKNSEVYDEIKIKKSRIENLLEELPDNVVKKIESLSKKGPLFVPLSQITEQNNCQMCGHLTPMALISSIEKYQRFHSCPACERILIPQSSKY